LFQKLSDYFLSPGLFDADDDDDEMHKTFHLELDQLSTNVAQELGYSPGWMSDSVTPFVALLDKSKQPSFSSVQEVKAWCSTATVIWPSTLPCGSGFSRAR
jgi:hypothetical protein